MAEGPDFSIGRVPTDSKITPGEDTIGLEWPTRAIWGFVILGSILRIVVYSLDFPLWWDEAFVAANLLRRDYAGLLRPLDYGQVCPLFFLWAELTIVRILGFSEWSLRLFPLLCSLASLVLFRSAAIRLLGPRAAFLAVAIFAVSVHPIRHAADVKPYATDLLVALILQALALRWWRHPDRADRLWALVAFVPIALLSSHPAVFVAGGLGLAIVRPVRTTRLRSVRLAFAAYGTVLSAAYATIYVLFTRSQAASASGGMKEMWANSFPPLDSLSGLVRWLLVAHGGDMMAYPCGGEGGGSSLSLLACLVGAVVLCREGRTTVVSILLAPLGVAMAAASLRLYPYGGPAPHGSAARIMQYAAPGFCLLIGAGAASGLSWISSASIRNRVLRVASVGLVVVGVAPLVEGFRHPYRAYHAEAARRFARQFWPEVARGAEVACLRWDLGVAEWDSIRLWVAVSLCNQAIYSPSRRSGGPRWGEVSRDRPLRCVLGVGPEADTPRVSSWVAEMRSAYEMTRRESIPVNTAEPGRRPSLERYEVFEFVPKAPGPDVARPAIHPVKGS